MNVGGGGYLVYCFVCAYHTVCGGCLRREGGGLACSLLLYTGNRGKLSYPYEIKVELEIIEIMRKLHV